MGWHRNRLVYFWGLEVDDEGFQRLSALAERTVTEMEDHLAERNLDCT